MTQKSLPWPPESSPRDLMPALDLCASRGVNLTKATRSSDREPGIVLVHPALAKWKKEKERG